MRSRYTITKENSDYTLSLASKAYRFEYDKFRILVVSGSPESKFSLMKQLNAILDSDDNYSTGPIDGMHRFNVIERFLRQVIRREIFHDSAPERKIALEFLEPYEITQSRTNEREIGLAFPCLEGYYDCINEFMAEETFLDAIFFVYDMEDETTFKDIEKQFSEYLQNRSKLNLTVPKIFFIGQALNFRSVVSKDEAHHAINLLLDKHGIDKSKIKLFSSHDAFTQSDIDTLNKELILYARNKLYQQPKADTIIAARMFAQAYRVGCDTKDTNIGSLPTEILQHIGLFIGADLIPRDEAKAIFNEHFCKPSGP